MPASVTETERLDSIESGRLITSVFFPRLAVPTAAKPTSGSK